MNDMIPGVECGIFNALRGFHFFDVLSFVGLFFTCVVCIFNGIVVFSFLTRYIQWYIHDYVLQYNTYIHVYSRARNVTGHSIETRTYIGFGF